jgi:hypothetical protein
VRVQQTEVNVKLLGTGEAVRDIKSFPKPKAVQAKAVLICPENCQALNNLVFHRVLRGFIYAVD